MIFRIDMPKKRLITVLTFNNGVLYRTKQFNPDYRYTSNFVDCWSVDEIIAIDVTRPGQGKRENFLKAVRDLSKKCFVPLTAGGGIRTAAHVEQLLRCGADKVSVNHLTLHQPAMVSDLAKKYGSQCIVGSVDVKRCDDSTYEVFSDFGLTPTGLSPCKQIEALHNMGVGECLLSSIDRDGSLLGYDLDLCDMVANAAKFPVVVLGGAGNWAHMLEVFSKTKVSGCCTQNIYHFTETSIRSAKAYLVERGVNVRH